LTPALSAASVLDGLIKSVPAEARSFTVQRFEREGGAARRKGFSARVAGTRTIKDVAIVTSIKAMPDCRLIRTTLFFINATSPSKIAAPEVFQERELRQIKSLPSGVSVK
jgi:hypothetical protein